MTITRHEDTIVLTGSCPIEEAEVLLTMVQEPWATGIVLQACGRLSTAVVQVLMAADMPVTGQADDPFVRDWVLPMLSHRRRGGMALRV